MFSKAAGQLRAARDLMNHGGKHWIKGAEKQAIDPKTHKPGDSPVWPGDYMLSYGKEYGYCSIGALGEVNAADIAKIELAKAIDPDTMKQVEKDILAEFEYDHERAIEQHKRGVKEGFESISEHPGKFSPNDPYVRDTINDALLETADEVIIDFNDNDNTTWADVRNVFTKAARRLSQRKDA